MESHQGFFLTIGNGGGVELRLNGESLGIPGKVGKVVRVTVPKDAELLRVYKPTQQAGVEPVARASAQASVPKPDGGKMEDDGFDL